jgi:hypothetical protein
MDEDILIPAMFFVTVIVMSLGIPLVRSYIRRQDRAALPSALTPELERRLDRLESMVETVQVEVERMAEGQRFTTRLLSEGAVLPNAQPSRAAAPVRANESGVTHA